MPTPLSSHRSSHFGRTTRGGPASWISDVTVRDGALIGVGEIYTNSRQPDGGQPCIWLSSDGAHWTHQVVDLGPGNDSNVGSLAVFGGSVFLAGHVDRDAAIVWSSS